MQKNAPFGLTRIGALNEKQIRIVKTVFDDATKGANLDERLAMALRLVGEYKEASIRPIKKKLKDDEDFMTTLAQIQNMDRVTQKSCLNVLDQIHAALRGKVAQVERAEFTKQFPLGVERPQNVQSVTKTVTSVTQCNNDADALETREMTQDQLRAFWSRVANSEEADGWPASQRVRASELLAKSLGMFDEPPKEVVVEKPFQVSQKVLAALSTNQLQTLQEIMQLIEKIDEEQNVTDSVTQPPKNGSLVH